MYMCVAQMVNTFHMNELLVMFYEDDIFEWTIRWTLEMATYFGEVVFPSSRAFWDENEGEELTDELQGEL